MDQRSIISIMAAVSLLACGGKKENKDAKNFTIQPQLIRLPLAGASALQSGLGAGLIDPANDTSLMQNFTPTSIRLSISDIRIASGEVDDWNSPSSSIYYCKGATNKECMVEVSDLKDFEDALNAEPAEIQPGTYNKVLVGMCAEVGGKQTIEITGSTSLNGTTYITDPTHGIIAGAAANAKPVSFDFGGCAVQVPLAQPIVAELTEEQEAAAEAEACVECAPTVSANVGLRLLFDSYNFASMGNMLNNATKQLVANSADNLDQIIFNAEDSECKGDKAGLFICTQRTALYATDDKAPQIKRFAITLTDSQAVYGRSAVANPDPVAYTGIMLRSDNVLLAAYTRRSVAEGAAFNASVKGDENYFKVIKNADGSYQLSEGPLGTTNPAIYNAFKLDDHVGERLMPNGIDRTPYKAALLK